tara:strand:- start:2371 stop:2958 length:588 start_codon:yes stop_codon:yes gene_type:complete
MSDKAPVYMDLTPTSKSGVQTLLKEKSIAIELLPDPTVAIFGLLESADATAHALATSGGCDPIWCGLYLTEGQTGYVRIRVPPGVTECDLKLRVAGSGSATVTTSTDATGTLLTWETEASVDLLNSGNVGTVGVMPTSAGAASRRAVTVRSSVAWTWADEVLTVASSSAGGVDGAIYGVLVTPIQDTRDATAGSY